MYILVNVVCNINTVDHASRRPPFDDDQLSVRTEKEDYDPSKHNPVLYGKMHAKVIL